MGTGLMDYNARFYAPGLGRWTQPDTIVPGVGNPQAWNRFSYVLNSSLNFTDPDGRMPKDCIDGVYCGTGYGLSVQNANFNTVRGGMGARYSSSTASGGDGSTSTGSNSSAAANTPLKKDLVVQFIDDVCGSLPAQIRNNAYFTRCENYRMGWTILTHPNTSTEQALLVDAILSVDMGMHIMFFAGAGASLCFALVGGCIAAGESFAGISAAACADMDCINEARTIANLWPQITGNDSVIHVVNNVQYAEHAVRRAIERGISPGQVEQVLRFGQQSPNTMRPDLRTLILYGDIGVVMTHAQNVVTTIFRVAP